MRSWEVVSLPPGISCESDAHGPIAVGLRHPGCDRVTVTSRVAVERRAGTTAPCFHCFKTALLPDRQGSLL